MKAQRRTIATYFFSLAIIGLLSAWYFNFLAVLGREDYLADGFTSNVDWVYSLDLLIGGIAGMTLIVIEGRRLGMKHLWAYIALGFVTAFAFVFPLFLGMRELRLRRIDLAGGRIDTYEFDKHRVDVWVPPSVSDTTPVLVMHDGKNVFFSEHSTFGATWGILDALRDGRIRAEKKPLIIAVWGLSDATRINELGPEDLYVEHPEIFDMLPPELMPATRTPMSNAYQSLVATRIVPELAAKYGIALHPDRTAIAGSSMGGLASLYGLAKHPDVYGTALCYSTHWPFGFEITVDKLTKLAPPAGHHRIWTDTGTIELDAIYPPFHAAAAEKLAQRGYRYDVDFIHAIYPNTGHSETWWAGRVEHPINWWLDPNEPRTSIEERRWVGKPQS